MTYKGYTDPRYVTTAEDLQARLDDVVRGNFGACIALTSDFMGQRVIREVSAGNHHLNHELQEVMLVGTAHVPTEPGVVKGCLNREPEFVGIVS